MYNVLKMGTNCQETLNRGKHAKYFLRFLNLLPARLASHDSTRGTIAFFAVCGLDVLNSLSMLDDKAKSNIVEWIYRFQVAPKESDIQCGGFQGSSSVNIKSTDKNLCENAKHYQWGHLAMTYTSIATLVTLGDDLSRVDREAIIRGVAAVQREDGSFSASVEGNEHDMRFVYCAAAICAMLNDWGTINKEKMVNYIVNSIRYDYGISQHLEVESHGGTTYCAVAALDLSGQLNKLDTETLDGIRRWLLFRQVDGFQGRPNKPVDTCYSFWIGAALKILDAFQYSGYEENKEYILSTQDEIVGGFSKWPSSNTDPFHTYFGLCGLSFIGEPGLLEVMPSLNISMRAYKRLQSIHQQWSKAQMESGESKSYHIAVEIE